MGYSFSNIHIKKRDDIQMQQVQESLCHYLGSQNHQLVSREEDSDFALYILESDSGWFSVCCDAIEFFSMESVRAICEPVSTALHTDVIASSCFDSDFLFLNLINAEKSVDCWAKFGKDETKCFSRRNAYKPWNGHVSDIEALKKIFKTEYLLAEEAWHDMEPLLQMLPNQGLFSTYSVNEFAQNRISVLYFASPGTKKKGPPKLNIATYVLTPCKIGQNTLITAINTGGPAKGLAVAFSGNYVETDDLTFRDVQLEYAFDRYPRQEISLSLDKIKTQAGQWIYYAEIPGFVLPEGVKEGLPWNRQMDEERKRTFGIRFTPEGNVRKCLDICVHFIPLADPGAQCSWCVWHLSGSKRAFIEKHNELWANTNAPNLKDILLDPDNFDE